MRAIFIRHGQSTGNVGIPANDLSLLELTDLGWRESREVAASWTEIPSLIVTSPYLRTQQTAAATIARFRDVAVEVWPIQEFTYLEPSRWNGTRSSERMPYIERYWAEADPEYCDGDGAESFSTLLERAQAALDRLAALPEDVLVYVFSHGQFIQAVRSLVVDSELADREKMRKFRGKGSPAIANAERVELDWHGRQWKLHLEATMTAKFGATSTAEEVLRGVNLSGKRALVTGVSAGIGVEIVRALLAKGANVIGTARNLDKAKVTIGHLGAQAVSGGELELVELDLASLASVRSCADSLLLADKPLDGIIANAGLMVGPKAATADGIEAQFGTNYLGHFVLINRLAPLLTPGARVVMVSSAGHRRTDIELDDPNFERTPYNEYLAYGRSKTATILFAVEFDRRYRSRGIRAMAVHPGAIQTETVQKLIEGLGPGKDAAVAAFDWKTVPQGAATSVWAAFVALADDVGGRYCEDCHVTEVIDDPSSKIGVRSYALDPERAKALWALGEEMTKEHFPASEA
jgi:NAD(P)-dependent dehydrogenase (short-subunit alcohol dehydrogenase family)/broad specificity phosphatase PhoE